MKYSARIRIIKMKACSIFGHSSIEVTEELRKGLKNVIEEKITKENFGY